MKLIQPYNDATIAQNSSITTVVNLGQYDLAYVYDDTNAGIILPITVQMNHTGGTITLTANWSLNGKNWVAQAFAGIGDVAGILAATGTGWDNLFVPAVASQLQIVCTEDNAAACTQFDLTIGLPTVG